MSMYPHRGMGGVPPGNTRLNELLEQIRAEFDTQLRQAENFEHQSTIHHLLHSSLAIDHVSQFLRKSVRCSLSERRCMPWSRPT